MKLTDARCRAEKPGTRHRDLSDDGTPLTLRVKANGEKIWLWRGRIARKQTKRIIGVFPEMSLGDARLEAMRLKQLAKRDPTTVTPVVHPHHRVREPTVSEALDRYEKERLADLKTGIEIRSMLDRKVMHRFGRANLRSLTRIEINQHFNKLRDDGYNGPALNRVLAAFKAFLTWCVKEDLLDFNPAQTIEKKIKEKPRNRVLADWELAAILKTRTGRLANCADPIQLLLRTACRKSDIWGLTWGEVIERDNGDIELHIEETKAEVGHIAWLAPQARKLLPERPKGAHDRDRVFKDAPLTGGKFYHKVREAIANTADREMENWTFHDFRTACTTYASDQKGRGNHYFSDRALEYLLAHIPTGVTRRHYNMSASLDERQEILTLWNHYLDECVEKSKKNNADSH